MQKNFIKKTLVIGIIVLFLSASAIVSVGNTVVEKEEASISQVNLFKVNKQPITLTINKQSVNYANKYGPSLGNPLFDYAGDQTHPAIARSDTGLITAAFYNESMNEIIWTSSDDDGATFEDQVYWEINGTYPSLKKWNDKIFFGTFVTDSDNYDGGATYLFIYDDDQNPSYILTGWDWSVYGWYDMIDADIACDNSQNDWEWGFSSYVISSTYGDGYTNIFRNNQ